MEQSGSAVYLFLQFKLRRLKIGCKLSTKHFAKPCRTRSHIHFNQCSFTLIYVLNIDLLFDETILVGYIKSKCHLQAYYVKSRPLGQEHTKWWRGITYKYIIILIDSPFLYLSPWTLCTSLLHYHIICYLAKQPNHLS